MKTYFGAFHAVEHAASDPPRPTSLTPSPTPVWANTDLCRLVGLLGGTLGLAGRVAQREDDGLGIDLSHLLQNLGCERPRLGRRAWNQTQQG